VITAQTVEPCLGQTNDVEIGGTNIIKYEFFGPETSNFLIINAETVAEIRMRQPNLSSL
jgi:hypothetical protein